MRQPLSIYARSSAIRGQALWVRVRRKSLKLLRLYKEPPRVAAAKRPALEIAYLNDVLNDLGISTGDRLMVHSGISNLGKVLGGAKALLDLLRDRVGERGTLLFPAFPFGGLMAEYLRSNPTFQTRVSLTKMGALSEVALFDESRVRSVHPTHSLVGFGDQASTWLADHHLDQSPFGPHSGFHRLAEARGKILLIGVGLSSVTGFHLVEDQLAERFPVRVYLPESFKVPCTSDNGEEFEVQTRCHDPFISQVRDCYLMDSVFKSEGIYRSMPVGLGEVGVIDAFRMNELLKVLALERRKTIYGTIWG